MLGVPSDDLEIVALSNPRQIGLQLGNSSFDAVFRSLFAQIDLYAENPAMLNYAGIDDTFYRNLVIAFNPTPFIRQIEARKVPSDQRRLQRVCEYVMANLSNCITLTDLERVAHISRRTLHNAFIKTYKQSPMYWVREQRLLKAMKLLGDRNGFLSVTEVLYSCGFTQPSLFSAQYARRFGELPSETLMQAQKGS